MVYLEASGKVAIVPSWGPTLYSHVNPGFWLGFSKPSELSWLILGPGMETSAIPSLGREQMK